MTIAATVNFGFFAEQMQNAQLVPERQVFQLESGSGSKER